MQRYCLFRQPPNFTATFLQENAKKLQADRKTERTHKTDTLLYYREGAERENIKIIRSFISSYKFKLVIVGTVNTVHSNENHENQEKQNVNIPLQFLAK